MGKELCSKCNENYIDSLVHCWECFYKGRDAKQIYKCSCGVHVNGIVSKMPCTHLSEPLYPQPVIMNQKSKFTPPPVKHNKLSYHDYLELEHLGVELSEEMEKEIDTGWDKLSLDLAINSALDTGDTETLLILGEELKKRGAVV